MNVYAVIILSTLLLDYTLNLLADCCNLRALRHELPAEFADVYDAAAYRKVAGVYTCADPFWHTDINVYAGCDPGILVR